MMAAVGYGADHSRCAIEAEGLLHDSPTRPKFNNINGEMELFQTHLV